MSKQDIKAGGAYVELAVKDAGFHERFAKAGDKLLKFAAAVVSVRGVIDGAKATFNALSAPVKQFIETGNALDKMSKQTGVSVEQLSKLKYAADQSEVSLDAIGQAMLHLRSRRVDPKQFDEIAAAVGAIEDPVQRAQAATRAFGSAGEALLPMLGNLEAMQAEAEKLGIVMDGDAAAAAGRLKDMFRALWATLQQGVQAIGTAMAPFLEVALPIIQAFTTTAMGQIKAAGDFIAANVETVTTFVSNAWQAMYDFAAPIIGAFSAVAIDAFNGIWEVYAEVFTSILELVQSVWGGVAESTGGIMQWMQDTIIGALEAISFGWQNWKTLLTTVIVSAELSVVRFANQVVYFFSEVIPGWLSWFGENWSDVFTDVASITATIAGNIWENLANLWDAIKGLFNGDGFEFEWTGLTEGFESAVKEWPKIAEREMGSLEKSLQGELDGLATNLTTEWEKHGKEFAAAVSKYTPKDEIGDLVKKASADAKASGDKLNGATPSSKAMQSQVSGTFSAAAAMAMGQGGNNDPTTKAIDKASREQKERDGKLLAAVDKKGGLKP